MRSAEIGPKTGPTSSGGRLSQPSAKRQNPRHSRDSEVELAGLEPATSWVRLALSLACLRGFRARGGPSGGRVFGQFPLISAGIGPKKRVFGPISRSGRAPASGEPSRGGPSCAGINELGCRVRGQRVRARVGEAAQASARDRGHAASVDRDRVDVPACCGGEGREHDFRASGDQEGRSSLGRSGRRSRPAGRLALYLGSGAVCGCRCALRAASCGCRRRCGGRATSHARRTWSTRGWSRSRRSCSTRSASASPASRCWRRSRASCAPRGACSPRPTHRPASNSPL
jgi:hypothetical protein